MLWPGAWWWPGITVAGGNNNNNRGDGSPALLCHYTPVMSRSIYTRPLSTAQAALSSPVLSSISPPLWALRPSPAFKYPTEIRFTYTWTPTFSLHAVLYIFLRTWLDLPSSINLHRIARMLDRPGLRPGCDTEALAGEFLLLYLWWNAFSGSRGVGTRALQHSGIWAERGGEVMLWTFPSYSSLCAHRSSQQWTVTFWY